MSIKNCFFVIVIFFISMFFFLKPKPDFFIEDNLIIPYASSVEILDKEYKQIGSGTIILNKKNKSMLILSSYHVVESEKEIFISVSYDDIKRKVLILKQDPQKDLVLLKSIALEKSNGPFIKMSNKNPKIGQRIFIISNPGETNKSVADGIIGSILYRESNWGDRQITSSLYRITAPIFYGSSGGGVFNEKGNFVGVVIGTGEFKSYINIKNENETIKDFNVFCVMPKAGASFAISLNEVSDFLELDYN